MHILYAWIFYIRRVLGVFKLYEINIFWRYLLCEYSAYRLLRRKLCINNARETNRIYISTVSVYIFNNFLFAVKVYRML